MKKQKRNFSDFIKDAENIKGDSGKIEALIEAVKYKVLRNKSHLGKVIGKIRLMIRMVRSYATGRYREIPASRIVLIIAALIYIVSPFDAVFDFLPGGYIDDTAIVIWLFNALSNEIEAYRKWEIEQGFGQHEGARSFG